MLNASAILSAMYNTLVVVEVDVEELVVDVLTDGVVVLAAEDVVLVVVVVIVEFFVVVLVVVLSLLLVVVYVFGACVVVVVFCLVVLFFFVRHTYLQIQGQMQKFKKLIKIELEIPVRVEKNDFTTEHFCFRMLAPMSMLTCWEV